MPRKNMMPSYFEMNFCSQINMAKNLGIESKQAFQVGLEMRKTQILTTANMFFNNLVGQFSNRALYNGSSISIHHQHQLRAGFHIVNVFSKSFYYKLGPGPLQAAGPKWIVGWVSFNFSNILFGVQILWGLPKTHLIYNIWCN